MQQVKPFAIHPKIRAQLEKEDAKKPEAEKTLKKTKTKLDPASTTKAMKVHIIENKPKKKEVREYFMKRTQELESDEED